MIWNQCQLMPKWPSHYNHDQSCKVCSQSWLIVSCLLSTLYNLWNQLDMSMTHRASYPWLYIFEHHSDWTRPIRPCLLSISSIDGLIKIFHPQFSACLFICIYFSPFFNLIYVCWMWLIHLTWLTIVGGKFHNSLK